MDSDNIFEGLKENKKTLIIVFVLFILVIGFSVLNLFLDNNNEDNIDMKGIVKSFAEIYYEEYYYPGLRDSYNAAYYTELAKVEKEGITLTLREIVNTFNEVNATEFYQEGNYCDFLNTYAVIYPKAPYEIDDYEIVVNVSCDKEIFAE